MARLVVFCLADAFLLPNLCDAALVELCASEEGGCS